MPASNCHTIGPSLAPSSAIPPTKSSTGGAVLASWRDCMIRIGAFAENTKPSGASSRHFA